MNKLLALFFWAALFSAQSVLGEEWNWAEAAKNIETLDPATVPEFSEILKAQLKSWECRIPTGKVALGKYRGPVDGMAAPGSKAWTKVSFLKRSQQDWAVVCARNDKTDIRIVWGGQKGCSDIISGSEVPNGKLIEGGESVEGKFYYFGRYLSSEKSKAGFEVLIEGLNRGSHKYSCRDGKWKVTKVSYGE